MDEQTQTPTDVGASAQLDVEPTAPASAPAVTDEQRLEKLLRNLVKGLVAAVAIFAVVYFFGQRQSHVEQAPAIPDQAIVSAEVAVRESPNDLGKRLQLAGQYANADRLDDALAQLREILKADAAFRPALLGLGEILHKQGKFEDAQSALKKYVATASKGEFASEDPKLEFAHYLLGVTEAELGNDAAAAASLQKAVDIDSADADAWYALGLAQLELKRFADAVNSFNRAIAFVPAGWCEPFEGLAEAYEGVGVSQGSVMAAARLRICEGGGMASAEPLKSLVLSPFGVEALFGLGLASEADGENADAIEYYQQLLSLDRTNIAALTALNRLGASPSPKPIAEK